jgi:SAM-dependent MidA family methyltransferase
MEWALYHPAFGYYSTGPNIGPKGDFTTSPEASPAFGRLLADHVADVDTLLGHPDPLHVLECGPGRGTLASDVLDALASENQELYGRLRYILVEISPALASEQQARLLPRHRNIVEWVRSLDQLPAGLDVGLIANELVDAFPVHVLENRQGEIAEHYVAAAGGALTITYGPPSRPELTEFLERHNLKLLPGERIEINLAMRDWLDQVARVMGRGVATVIDYGDISPARYSEARRQGTLLGYYGGAVTDKLLAHPGKQDLTALVDFTAFQEESIVVGLEVLALTRQANFLLGLGLGTTVTADTSAPDVGAVLANRRGLQALVSPEGLGKFHVLVLIKGVELAAARSLLSGLKYAEIGE